MHKLYDRMLSPALVSCFGFLRSVDWQFVTDVSGQPIGPTIRGEAAFFLECLTDRWSRNCGKKPSLYEA